MTDGSFDEIGALNERDGGVAEGEDVVEDGDNILISWPILLSIIVGLFAIFLILIFAFICFRSKIENEPRNFQSQNTRSNGLFVEKLEIFEWDRFANESFFPQIPAT